MPLPPKLPPPIEGPSAWTGPAMATQDDWIYCLNAAELDEIDAAADAAADKPMIAVSRADFPLPTLGPVLDRLRGEVLRGRGFVLLRGLPTVKWPRARTALAYWGLGSYFGRPRSQNAQGHMLGHVRDLGFSTDDPNIRIYQTRERQNYHTDASDIVGLLCLHPARSGGLSALVSSMTIYNGMHRMAPDLLRALFDGYATDRRGEVPAGQKPYYMMPVYHWWQGNLSCVYSKPYILSAQAHHPDAPRLDRHHREALTLFDQLANDPRLNFTMRFEPGDIQFVHNHTVLHDRTAFEDFDAPEKKRHLLRLWLSAPDARPLPDSFLEWYGSTTVGDRGGIFVPGTTLQAPLNPL